MSHNPNHSTDIENLKEELKRLKKKIEDIENARVTVLENGVPRGKTIKEIIQQQNPLPANNQP